jgi:hypothetical protein
MIQSADADLLHCALISCLQTVADLRVYWMCCKREQLVSTSSAC